MNPEEKEFKEALKLLATRVEMMIDHAQQNAERMGIELQNTKDLVESIKNWKPGNYKKIDNF